jgi:hypothetical protein
VKFPVGSDWRNASPTERAYVRVADLNRAAVNWYDAAHVHINVEHGQSWHFFENVHCKYIPRSPLADLLFGWNLPEEK